MWILPWNQTTPRTHFTMAGMPYKMELRETTDMIFREAVSRISLTTKAVLYLPLRSLQNCTASGQILFVWHLNSTI